MATATLSDYANVTREAHRKNVEFLGNKTYWLDKNFQVGSQPHGGESLVWQSFQTALPESATPSAEMALDPTPVNATFDKGKVYVKKQLAKMLYSEETVNLNQGDEAIIKDLTNLRNGTLSAYNLLKEFSVHTPGSGVLGQATGAASGHVITVDDIRWFRKGMRIDGYHTNSIEVTSASISSVDVANKTITIVDPSGDIGAVDANTKFYYEGTFQGASETISATKFTNGIETICSGTDPAYGYFMGIERAAYPYMQATHTHGSTPGTPEAFTTDRMITLYDLADNTVGGEYLPNLGYMTNGVFNNIYKTFKLEQQPTVNMPAKDGIPAGLEFQYGGLTIRLVKSRFAPAHTILFPNLKHIFKYTAGKEGWQVMAGQVQQVANYQAFSEVYRGWRNWGTDFPEANLAMFDVLD
jgi:hypothetical protein